MHTNNNKKVVKLSLLLVIVVAVRLQLWLQNPDFLRGVDKFLDSFQSIENHLQNHFYLSGNYAPVNEEHRDDPVNVTVSEGVIPEDLAGFFVRNGPNPVPGNMTKRYHWFDGNGMLHNLRFRNGEAFYTNVYIPTPRYIIEKQAGEQIFLTIGSVTGISGLLKVLLLSSRLPHSFQLSQLQEGTANTNVLMFRSKLYCLHESSLPFEVRLSGTGDIAGLGYETFDNVLDFPFTAHPKKDFLTGNLVFFGYDSKGSLKVGEVSGVTGKVILYQGLKFPQKHISFVHDFCFTKNWILILDSSVRFDPASILKTEGSFFSMETEANFQIGLFPRGKAYVAPTDVIWVALSEPLALVHTLNAWEDTDGLITIYAPLSKTFNLESDKKAKGNDFHMAEIRINPVTRDIVKEWIDTQYIVEFPRVREECLGRFCQYGFAGILSDDDDKGDGMFIGFVKIDMKLKRVHSVVKFRDGESGGEPVLISKPIKLDDEDQSDHVFVGTYVFNSNDQKSYFLLFDGEQTSQDPVARLLMPFRVPYGFHGLWIKESELTSHLNYHQSLSEKSKIRAVQEA